MQKYKQNLDVRGNKVFSYGTHVATIEGSKLLVHGWWSMTTSKHVNYVADELGLTKVDNPKPKEEEEPASNFLNTVGLVAKMGDFFADNQKDKNDWKLRMIKAGMPEGALHMPEDWDQLSEEEKETRLNKIIEVFQS